MYYNVEFISELKHCCGVHQLTAENTLVTHWLTNKEMDPQVFRCICRHGLAFFSVSNVSMMNEFNDDIEIFLYE
jgi:hypothetical protein